MFLCVERGSNQDEKALIKLLKNEDRETSIAREDPKHLINAKNVFGQTPLYVACKHGNLNMVRLLIDQGCNPFIKSSVDKQNEENNL